MHGHFLFFCISGCATKRGFSLGGFIEQAAPECEEHGADGEQRTDPGRGAEPERRGDDEAAEPGAKRDTEIKSGDVERRCRIHRTRTETLGKLDDIELQAGHGGEGQEAERDECCESRQFCRGGESE